MNTTERTTLYYREGSSDKVYQAWIEPAGNLFVVNFAFGRRGSTLNTGTKTNSPVAYANARTIFEKLVREKKAKGYSEGVNAVSYEAARNTGEHTGITPQLLNPVAEDEVEALLHSNDWCMQEKFDGRRVLIRKEGNTVTGVNRRGFAIGLPKCVGAELGTFSMDFLLDGEAVGERYHVFDLLSLAGEDLRTTSYRTRLAELIRLIGFGKYDHLLTVLSYIAAGQKQMFLAEAKAQRKEGVVFKHLEAPYTAGRPSSGGTQLKHKFCATLSARVVKRNAGRSVELALKGNGGWQSCGNVTVPVNHAMPSSEDIVEVRYLYAFPESGALFQPVYLGPRSDLDLAACTTDQLKFKASDEDEP